ncbi:MULTISPECIES: hypothetical protein [unclassified Duganella]|uniref:hypothetical protein n=1 Tax=unclassified Duganella TaxID=2636909 RepID=UPI0011C17B1A|nr:MULTISPECIES: hypothetical protein [unclassified Duganella]
MRRRLIAYLIRLAFAIPCAFSLGSEIGYDTEPKIDKIILEERGVDVFNVEGRYLVDEGGEVFMRISWPEKKRLTLGFSNEDSAVRQFGIEEAIKKIDLKRFCGLEGTAAIQISNMQMGEGPARKWHTAQLVRVIAKQPYKMLACSNR